MRKIAVLSILAIAAALAGCQRDAATAPEPAASVDAASEIASEPAALPTDMATSGSSPIAGGGPTAPATQPGGAVIPAALQGRWGLVPADCTSTRGDAKGLLVIGPDTLRFYESTARAGAVSEESATRIRANFAFSGEGSVWTREMVLETGPGGSTLTRRDFGGDAGPNPLTYTRC